MLHLPAVQSFLGKQVATAVGEKLGTTVRVGHVDIGLLNRIVIDNVEILDQSDKSMLKASRLSAKYDITPLFKGRISISSAQLFGLKARLYKATADSEPNFQFVLDSLASKDDTPSRPLDLNISSLIVRNGSLAYDQLDAPMTEGQLNPKHLNLSNLSCHLMLHRLTDDMINLRVKRISFAEQSGLQLDKLSLNLDADKKGALLTELHVALPNSSLIADTLRAEYQFQDDEIIPQSVKFDGCITESHIYPGDLAPIVPQLREFNNSLSLSSRFSGTLNSVKFDNLNLDAGAPLKLACSGYYDKSGSHPTWFAQIGHLEAQADAISKFAKNFGTTVTIPEEVLRLGSITLQGEVGGKAQEIALRGHVKTDAGELTTTGSLSGNHLVGHLETDGVDLKRILADDNFGMLATTIDVDGVLPLGKGMTLSAKGDIARIDYKQHTYNNIQVDGIYRAGEIDGLFGIDDPNGELALNGHVDLSGPQPSANITATARHFNPQAMGLVPNIKGYVMDFELQTDMSGNALSNLQGEADLTNLVVQTPGKTYRMENLHLDTDNSGASNRMKVKCDFGELEIDGKFNYETIGKSLANIVRSKLPTLPILPSTSLAHGDELHIASVISDSRWANDLLGIDVGLNSPLAIEGWMNERDKTLDLSIWAPSIVYDDDEYRDIQVVMTTQDNALKTNAQVTMMLDNDKHLKLNLSSTAADNLLHSDITFNSDDEENQVVHGTISTVSEFYMDLNHREAAHVRFQPSEIYLNDTPWNVQPSDLVLSKNNIVIDQFSVENGNQHVKISGTVTDGKNDTIHVDMNHLDAEFISNIINVSGVDFGGQISGDAYVTSVFDKPQAKANLMIDDFKFTDGRIGEMNLAVNFNDNRIELDGHAIDKHAETTDVKGYISLEDEEIELNILPRGTSLDFLETFTESFMGDIDVRVAGSLRLFGPLDEINLEGKVVANGDLFVKSLNTHYTMVNDTVTLIPNHIIFNNDIVYDRDGHTGIVTGSVDHDELSDFTFDIGIRANNLLAYDFKEFGDDTFCGTVYATGTCHIKSEGDGTVIDVDATTNPNTIFYYNAASPEALSSQDFITWNDVTPEALDFSDLPSASGPGSQPKAKVERTVAAMPEIPSDLRMNFRINATPDATLRLLMDAESGDYVALNGSGSLRASYFNKGSFNLYGNYLVDHGLYHLTIQNVIKKEFDFEQGGTIAFGGNPYDAALNLKAIYVVNGVPLSDLNLGQSFSTNNIRVNCIMNITGTPEHPKVDFDMELPTVNSDAEQMVRSLINSEEELNQQMIYLLAIGRFYNQNSNAMSETGQSQTSLAMQSLLSGTISQQINNVLKNFIKTSNWNFGANISTGNEGFNNAEYEGLLSGRLLNNRLLINGQFGYRDNPNATTSFIGDFDIRYLLLPNGNLAVKVYNQANDRYFIKNSLNTQGLGLIMKKDFNGWRELLGIKRKEKKPKTK